MEGAPPPPAGWYPDPTGPGHRWWDGGRWTEHWQPPAPPGHHVVAGPLGPGGLVTADFGTRLGAYFIDYGVAAVLGFGAVLVIGIASLIGFALGGERGGIIVAIVSYVIAYIPLVAWPVVCESTRLSQTPGKHWLRIRIVDDRGQPIGWGKAWGRLFAKLLSALVFGLGFLWMLWDAERRTWHDRMTGTWVVAVPDQPLPVDEYVRIVTRRDKGTAG